MLIPAAMKLLPVGFCVLFLATNLAAQNFYVAPSGSDANDGSLASPFQTIGRAKTAAASALQAGSPAVQVFLRAGKYQLIAPAADPLAPGLLITDADTRPSAAMTFSNYPGETAIIHGAIEFSGSASGGTWSDATLVDVYNGNISPTALKSVAVKKFTFTGPLRDDLQARIQNLRAAHVNGGHFAFTQLYREESSGPVKKIRARQPNDSMNVDTSHFTWDGEKPLDNQKANCRFRSGKVVRTGGIPRFIDNGHTEIRFTRMWSTVRAIINSPVTNSQGDILVSLPAMENPKIGENYTYPFEATLAEVNGITSYGTNQQFVWETWNQGWMENNIHFLDAESEWFFDEDNIVLYYRPPTGEVVETSIYSLPVTYSLIQLRGSNDDSPVRNVRFVGEVGVTPKRLQFAKTAWKYENGRGNSEYYTFRDLAPGLSGLIDGIYVNAVTVLDCAFNDTGASAIVLGGNRKNMIGHMDSGQYDNQPRGMAANVTISRNTFSKCGGSAIRIDHYPILNSDVLSGSYRFPGSEDYDNNWISENDISGVGVNFTEAPGIAIFRGINTIVENNTVLNGRYIGIEIGASFKRTDDEDNKIRLNTIDHCMTTLSDGAGIYARGGRGTNIINNFFQRVGTPRAADAVVVAPFMMDLYLDRNTGLFDVSGNARLATEGPLRLLYRLSGNHNIWQPGASITLGENLTKDDYGWSEKEAPFSSGADLKEMAMPDIKLSAAFGGTTYKLEGAERLGNGDFTFYYNNGSTPLYLIYTASSDSWECRFFNGTVVPPTDYQGGTKTETIAKWIKNHGWYDVIQWPTNNLSLL